MNDTAAVLIAIGYLAVVFGSIVIGLYGTCFIARYKNRKAAIWVVAAILTFGFAHLLLICMPKLEPKIPLKTIL